LIGIALQVPALLLLLDETFDMHNRFSVLLSLLLPYVAIADRMLQPSSALMAPVAILTFLQYPLYGTLIGFAWNRGRPGAALLMILPCHAVAAAVAIGLKIVHA
jgi:hypothetical protein